MLRLIALPAGTITGVRPCTIAAIGAFRHHVIGADGVTHVLLEQDRKVLQLRISGKCDFEEPVQLFLEIPIASGRIKGFLQACQAFNGLSSGSNIPAGFDRPSCDTRRLMFTLKALDGWMAGESLREIAVSLFGRERTESDWGSDSDYLKSQVRRLVSRGRWLMAGGYRSLLR